MITIPDDTSTPKIKAKKTFNYTQPYANRENFQISWDSKSVICAGIFYSKTGETLKETKFFQISSSSLIRHFAKNLPLPSLTYNRRLLSKSSSVLSKKHSLVVAQLDKIMIVKRSSFIHREGCKKGTIPFVFSGKLGLQKISKIYQIRHNNLDLIAVLGYQRKGFNSTRLTIFNVSTKMKLICFPLEDFDIKSNFLKIIAEDVDFIIIGYVKPKKRDFEVLKVDLKRRSVLSLDIITNKKFSKVRYFLKFNL